MASVHVLSRRTWLLTAITLVGAACQSRTHTPPKRLRVVSLSPNMSEIVFALGRGPWLVGRSRYCDYPPEVRKLPQVGGFADPSMEAILALRPQLVLGARGPAGRTLADKLRQHHIDVLFPQTDSIQEIKRAISLVGAKLNAQLAATKQNARMTHRLAQIASAVRPLPKRTVLLVFGHRPLVACGQNTFPNEMLTAAGAINVVRHGRQYPTMSVETVLRLDPDVIVDATFRAKGAPRITDHAGLSQLRASRTGHLVRLDHPSVMRPGPRVAQGVERLAHAIHPGLEIPP